MSAAPQGGTNNATARINPAVKAATPNSPTTAAAPNAPAPTPAALTLAPTSCRARANSWPTSDLDSEAAVRRASTISEVSLGPRRSGITTVSAETGKDGGDDGVTDCPSKDQRCCGNRVGKAAS